MPFKTIVRKTFDQWGNPVEEHRYGWEDEPIESGAFPTFDGRNGPIVVAAMGICFFVFLGLGALLQWLL